VREIKVDKVIPKSSKSAVLDFLLVVNSWYNTSGSNMREPQKAELSNYFFIARQSPN